MPVTADQLQDLYNRIEMAAQEQGVPVSDDIFETMFQNALFAKYCRKAVSHPKPDVQQGCFDAATLMLMGAAIYSDRKHKPIKTRGIYKGTRAGHEKILKHFNEYAIDRTYGTGKTLTKHNWKWLTCFLTKDGRWKWTKYKDPELITRDWNKAHPDDELTVDKLKERYKSANKWFKKKFGRNCGYQYIVSHKCIEKLIDELTELYDRAEAASASFVRCTRYWQDTDWSLATPWGRREFHQAYDQLHDESVNALRDCVWALDSWLPYFRKSGDPTEEKAFSIGDRLSQSFKEYIEIRDAHRLWLRDHPELPQLLSKDASALTDCDHYNQADLPIPVEFCGDYRELLRLHRTCLTCKELTHPVDSVADQHKKNAFDVVDKLLQSCNAHVSTRGDFLLWAKKVQLDQQLDELLGAAQDDPQAAQ